METKPGALVVAEGSLFVQQRPHEQIHAAREICGSDCVTASSCALKRTVPLFLAASLTFGFCQQRRLTRVRSMISSPRPLRAAFIMKRVKPLASSKVIVGGIESS